MEWSFTPKCEELKLPGRRKEIASQSLKKDAGLKMFFWQKSKWIIKETLQNKCLMFKNQNLGIFLLDSCCIRYCIKKIFYNLLLLLRTGNLLLKNFKKDFWSSKSKKMIGYLKAAQLGQSSEISVPDPWNFGTGTYPDPRHFGTYPDPRIRITDLRIRIPTLLFYEDVNVVFDTGIALPGQRTWTIGGLFDLMLTWMGFLILV